MDNNASVFILVDWGTTNFRAYLLTTDGDCLAERKADCGVARLSDTFEATLQAQIGEWLRQHPQSAVLLCGMVGSQIGWKNTPYVGCPVSLSGFTGELVAVPGFNEGRCWIVPGVRFDHHEGATDVMRGEELQVFGAMQLTGEQETTHFCCPGTHTKWVTTHKDKITSVQTSMTGELFALLSRQSILASAIEDATNIDTDAFLRGVSVSQRQGGILNQLFSVRTQFLMQRHSTAEGAGYLSGLLIGTEILSMRDAGQAARKDATTLIGSPDLCRLYQMAMSQFGLTGSIVDARDAAIAGAVALFNSVKERT